MKRFLFGAVAACAFGLSGCGQPAGEGAKSAQAETGKFGGLDGAIHTWKADLTVARAECAAKTPEGDPGCISFEVACKAEAVISPEEQAKGVTAKVTSGMRWQAWDAKRAEYLPGGQFATFSKQGDVWSRKDAAGGNPGTCAIY